MFICDNLIYIQMQKTGCTHIASLLDQLFDGRNTSKKHNAATPEQLNSGRYFISSIRNPWDWYLSLWTFGVQGEGGLKSRLIRNGDKEWQSVYDQKDRVVSFRRWLKMMHNSDHSSALGEGYGDTEITEFCGFMTYRYLYLCARNTGYLKERGLISSFDELLKFDHNNCYIDYFIRQEALEYTFCKAIAPLKLLSENEKKLIFGSGKTNTSIRKLTINEYYDKESIDIIYRREGIIINKFNYLPPAYAE